MSVPDGWGYPITRCSPGQEETIFVTHTKKGIFSRLNVILSTLKNFKDSNNFFHSIYFDRHSIVLSTPRCSIDSKQLDRLYVAV